MPAKVITGKEFLEMLGITRKVPMHFKKNKPPNIGQRVMGYGGCVFIVEAVSLFGDEVFIKPLLQSCWSDSHNDWIDVYHLGKESRWKKVDELIPTIDYLEESE